MGCSICDSDLHTAMRCPKVIRRRVRRGEMFDEIADAKSIDERIRRHLKPMTYDLSTLRQMTEQIAPPIPVVRKVEEPLEAVVARQLGELTRDLDGWHGTTEQVRPQPVDVTYAEAHATALRKCDHQDVNNVTYGRTWLCDDCGRYLDRKSMRAARRNDFWWTW